MNILHLKKFGDREVHVWTARIEDPGHSPLNFDLRGEERTMLGKMTSEKRRSEFVRGRRDIRRLAGYYLEISPDRVQIKVDDFGKPALDHGTSAPKFNLSHSSDRLVYAFSENESVGIDIEQLRHLDVNRLAAEHFNTEEYLELEGRSLEHEKLEFFFDRWTRKEAVSKYFGLGLRIPFREIEVIGDTARYEGERLFTKSFRWDDYRIAVAHSSDKEIIWKGDILV